MKKIFDLSLCVSFSRDRFQNTIICWLEVFDAHVLSIFSASGADALKRNFSVGVKR